MTTTALSDARGARVLADLVPGGLVRDVLLVAGAAALTGIAAQVSIPWWPVPVTLQTLTVLLAGAALGPVRGTASMLLYLAVGAAGVPWFAQGNHGVGFVTFGYVVGFVLAAALVGWLAQRGASRTVLGTIGAMVLGNLVIYACGVPYLAMAAYGGDLGAVVMAGAVPFLAGDGLKILLAAGLLPAAWRLAGGRR
ncbi:MAG TPA: biotin transporter BioY [Candidatus Limnocylindria bacterium]|nr:biotin transporter BioY [Candidatus Limnocylindria bacterium]